MASHARNEIYVRFYSAKLEIHGMHEAPCASIEEAAGQFVEDDDCISATRMSFDATGRVTGAEDVTAEVIEKLQELIEADTYTRSPHPMVEDFYLSWEREAEAAAEEQREHERIETALLRM